MTDAEKLVSQIQPAIYFLPTSPNTYRERVRTMIEEPHNVKNFTRQQLADALLYEILNPPKISKNRILSLGREYQILYLKMQLDSDGIDILDSLMKGV